MVRHQRAEERAYTKAALADAAEQFALPLRVFAQSVAREILPVQGEAAFK
jgi:hypothetical protein